ncbi:MAG: gluconate 2-dehydrogenase subunit 3 family protein [Acidobacteriota bacterium]
MADQSEKQKMMKDNNQPATDEAQDLRAQTTSNEAAGMSRREVLKLTASAIVAAPLLPATTQATQRKAAAKAPAPRFFTRAEFALVDELTELIIPTDDHSPGARAAKVAEYIDRRLAESFEAEPKQMWRDGLKLIETISQEMHGRAFLQATPDERIALLTRISQNEREPKKPEEKFFVELKARTVNAYYTSKIGIHTEMEYKGNTYLKEFVGVDAT